MKVRNQFFRLMAPDDDKGGGGGSGDASDAGGAGSGGAAAAGGDKGAVAAGDGKAAAAVGATGDQGVADKGSASDKGAAAATGGNESAPDWPEDWRTKIAGTDEKALARLARYSSPKDLGNALQSIQNRIGAGELRSTLPKNATEEQIATWREENGIPAAPDKYDLKLADGLVIGADDRPLIDNLLKSMHKVNAPASIASEVVNFYYAEVERTEAARHEKDTVAARTASDALHAEWGAEFRPNMNMIEGLLDTAPAGVKDLIKFGRLSDGTPIMAHPDSIRWLNNMAREINPVTTVVPNAGSNISGAIDDEIKKHEKNMGAPKGSADYKAYWNDEKAQARYRDLLNASDRSKKKGS